MFCSSSPVADGILNDCGHASTSHPWRPKCVGTHSRDVYRSLHPRATARGESLDLLTRHTKMRQEIVGDLSF